MKANLFLVGLIVSLCAPVVFAAEQRFEVRCDGPVVLEKPFVPDLNNFCPYLKHKSKLYKIQAIEYSDGGAAFLISGESVAFNPKHLPGNFFSKRGRLHFFQGPLLEVLYVYPRGDYLPLEIFFTQKDSLAKLYNFLIGESRSGPLVLGPEKK